MYKKAFFVRLLIIFFVMFLPNTSNAADTSKKLKIMMINWRIETEASRGFKDGMEELGYDVKYDEFVANQKMELLSEFLQSDFNPKNYDYIYTFSTTVSKLTHSALKDITPQIFTIVSFPVQSGLVKSLDKPGKNCTGATHYVSLELQIQTALKLFKFKSLLMIYNPNEMNSNLTKKEIAILSEKYKFAFKSIRAYSEKTLEEAIRKIRTGKIKVDIVYLPSDSMITTNIDNIVKGLIDAKQIHFSALKRDIVKGALFGLVNDYYKVGKAAAFLIDDNQKGTPIHEIPVKRFDNPKILVNKKTADVLGFRVPENYQNRIEFIGE